MILFLLGMFAAGVFAVGMDPDPCGAPLLLMSLAVLFGAWRASERVAKFGPTVGWIVLTVGYFFWRMGQSSIADFARSDALLLAGAILGFWWSAFCGNRTFFPRWMVGMWALLLANVAVAAWQQYGGPDVYEILGERETKLYPSGLYLHYNHFANFLLGVGLLSLGYGMAGRMKIVLRAACIVMYGLSVYGILLAHSRGAWLGLGCGTALILLGWLANLWRSRTSWAGVALIGATVLAPALVTGAWHFGSRAVADRNNGDSGRLEFASIAVDLIQEKPLWGGGSRSYFFDSMKKWNAQELWVGGGDIQYVHNEYLQAAVDYGLVGLVLLLGVMALVFFRGIVLLVLGDAKSVADRGVVLGSMAALCGMGVQAFFSFVYHVLPDVIMMGCCVGWLVRQPWWSTELKWRWDESSKKREWRWSQGLLASSLALAAMGLAARDTVVWWTLYPRFDFQQVDPVVRAERLQRALAWLPDFRWMSMRAKLLGAIRNQSQTKPEKRIELAEEAIELLKQSLRRAPDNYEDLIHLALLYDVLERFEEAEPIYEKVLPVLGPREMQYGSQYLYARHLMFRAQAMWRKRQPQQALVLFMRARDQLQKVTGRFQNTDPKLRETIEKSIRFLEGAKVKAP